MARQSKAQKALEAAYETAFKKHCNGVQFDIMDLGPLREETLHNFALVPNMDAAICAARDKFRKN